MTQGNEFPSPLPSTTMDDDGGKNNRSGRASRRLIIGDERERFNFPILASERWSGGLLPKEHSSAAPYFGRRRNEIRRRCRRLLKSAFYRAPLKSPFPGFVNGTSCFVSLLPGQSFSAVWLMRNQREQIAVLKQPKKPSLSAAL